MNTEVARDRWGRPLIVPAGGGKPVAYTRATTLAKTLDDEAALANWKMRMVAIGLARRPDLVALASTTTDKGQLDKVTQHALDAAASSARANVGTALHAIIEQVNRNEKIVDLLPALAADVDAYQAGTADIRLSMPETFVVNDTWQVAGTFDFLVESNGMVLIGDLKTGTDLSYSWRSIAVQLAVYANAEWIYEAATHTRHPMPDVDKRLGVVVHVPAGEGRCTLYTVDLVAGMEAAEASLWCREWRKNKTIALEWTPVVDEVAPPADAGAVDRLRDRAVNLIDAGHGDALAARWPAGVPTFRQGVADPAHLDAIETLLWDLEARTGQPFPPDTTTLATPVTPTPATPPALTIDEGEPLTAEERDAIIAAIAGLDPGNQARLAAIAAEAHAAGQSLNLRLHPTRRRWSIARALLCLATYHHLDDTLARDLIGRATGEITSAPLGRLIGALTISEADRLAELAEAIQPAHT